MGAFLDALYAARRAEARRAAGPEAPQAPPDPPFPCSAEEERLLALFTAGIGVCFPPLDKAKACAELRSGRRACRGNLKKLEAMIRLFARPDLILMNFVPLIYQRDDDLKKHATLCPEFTTGLARNPLDYYDAPPDWPEEEQVNRKDTAQQEVMRWLVAQGANGRAATKPAAQIAKVHGSWPKRSR